MSLGLPYSSDIYLIDKNNVEHSYQDLHKEVEHYRNFYAHLKMKSVGIIGDFDHQTIALVFALAQNNITYPLLDEATAELVDPEILFTLNASPYEKRATYITRTTKFPLRGESGLGFLTSGTSGKPKSICHSLHRLWLKTPQIEKSKTLALFLKYNHLGGWATLIGALKGQKTCISLPSHFAPSVLNELVDHKVELLPTTPSFLRQLNFMEGIEILNRSGLKKITFGTEPCDENVLKKLAQRLPDVTFKQTYGLTELGTFRTDTLGSNPAFFRINDPHWDWQIENNELLIKPRDSSTSWFATGDLVETILNNGVLYYRIIGRKSDLINISGEKFFPQPIEAVIQEIDGVVDSTILPIEHPFWGNILTAEVKTTRQELTEQDIRSHVARRLPPHQVPTLVNVTLVASLFSEKQSFKKNRRYKKTE